MTVIILQARMGSTRLPGKVMKEILGKPMLAHSIERLKRSRTVPNIILATTTAAADDEVAKLGESLGVAVFRGSERDVLDRYYQAAKKFGAETIVRVTGDCPMIDPGVIDEVVSRYENGNYDYVSNVEPPTYPDGLDTEVFSFSALQHAWSEAKLPSEREHVTPYIRNHPEIFKLGNVTYKTDLSNLRLTVDEPADLELARAIFKELYPLKADFALSDILALKERKPDIFSINSSLIRNEGYLKSLKEDEEFKKKTL